MLQAYQDVPVFLTGTPVSAIDLEVLRKNAKMLYDTVLRASPPVMEHQIDWRNFGNTNNMTSGIQGGGWQKFYHGSFMFHSGMTTLYFEMSYIIPTQPSPDTFKIYLMVNGNWELQTTQTLASGTSGSVSWTAPLTGHGFFDGEIVQVQIDYDKPGAPAEYTESKYGFKACFAYPTLNPDSWPGTPSFSTGTDLSATKLNQLSLACDWLIRKVNLSPLTPITASLLHTMSFIRSQLPPSGAFWHNPDQSMWSGGAIATNQHTKFVLGGRATFKDAQERYVLYADNTPVDYWPSSTTYGTPYTTQDWSVEYDMPPNSGVHFRMGNILLPNTGGNDDQTTGKGRTRHTINISRVENDGGYTVPTLAYDSTTKHVSRTNLTYATLLNRLNGIAEVLQNVYDHIGSNPLVFTRAYIVRPMLAVRNEDYQWNYKWSLNYFEARKGNFLWLRGKGVEVCWGPIKINHQKEEFEYDFLFKEEVIPGDKLQSTYISLDSLEGLFPGMPYYVRGEELQYAAESYIQY